jgi:HEPN domain-containing protein
MTNPQDIQDLADLRLREATGLINIGFPDAAFYLAGYAAELYLKAKICENLKLPNFYDQYATDNNLSATFLTHDLERLLLLSGSLLEFEADIKANISFRLDWERLLSWSETSIYDLEGSHSLVEAIDFINAVKNLKEWIKMN